MIPRELVGYLDVAVAHLENELGRELLGVYAGGSVALSGYVSGRSDVDIAAVVADHLAEQTKHMIVGLLRHEALPCPARGLELVVYPEATVRVATTAAGLELNLNTGVSMQFRVDFEPDVADAHWFAIDRSILSEHGIALWGPPAGELFAPIPRALLLPIVVESLRWHVLSAEQRSADAVLNACRSLRYAEEGRWSSKQQAGRWALARLGSSDVVAAALAGYPSSFEVDVDDASAFVALVLERVEAMVGSPGLA